MDDFNNETTILARKDVHKELLIETVGMSQIDLLSLWN